MPTYYFKIYRRVTKDATTGTLSSGKALETDDIEAARRQVSGHFAKFDFRMNFAVLEDEYGKQISYWLQDPHNA